MSMPPATIVARVTAAILAAQPTWERSPHSWYAFPPQKDPSSVQPRSFAVGLGNSGGSTASAPEGRQKAAVGAKTTTEVVVRYITELQADNQPEALEDGLGEEVSLVQAVLGVDKTGGIEIRFVGVSRSALAGGTLLQLDVAFLVLHQYPLS